MAPAHFVKKARKPIYQRGKQVTYEGRKGSKREGRTLTKIDRTIPADKKDQIMINVGESYWWWQFPHSPIYYSKTRPKRSQLTRSEFYSWLFDMEDDTIGAFELPEDIEDYKPEDLEATRDEWVGEIESQKEELESRLDNMPDGLRDSSVLNERIEGLDSWIGDLEGVDIDWDDEELKKEATEKVKKVTNEEAGISTEAVQEAFLDMKRQKIEELVEELQNYNCGL
jgi:hypothetical protein